MIRSYDIDGVIWLGNQHKIGIRPAEDWDVIITGRSFEEEDETRKMLDYNFIYNMVFYNPLPYEMKTRETSAEHKAFTLNELIDGGVDVQLHFEDDEIQAKIIEEMCPRVKVIRIVHDLTNKENQRQGEYR